MADTLTIVFFFSSACVAGIGARMSAYERICVGVWVCLCLWVHGLSAGLGGRIRGRPKHMYICVHVCTNEYM